MEPLSKIGSAIFIIGALLMLAGAVLGMTAKDIAPWLFAIGALAYTAMQMKQGYEGNNITIRRLRAIMLFSDVLLILVAALMFADHGNPFQLEYLTWLNYIHNNWVVLLLIAAVMQFYTVFRIDNELKKEAKKR
jgi:hypothetical protein